jgi:hypothetical protein
MAYDRYDTRDTRDRNRDDRYRDDRDYRGRDERGHDDGRGFFQRASDEISSWFGDDRDDDRDRGRGGYDRDGGDYDRGRPMRGDRADDRGYGRDYARDRDRDRGYRPITGDYAREGRGPGYDAGRDPRSEYERDPYRRTSYAGSSAPNDPHYHAWNRRQLEELARDYDDYRREHQSRFESEFGSWRERRQAKRRMLADIREHMEVVGNDGEHVGTVDKVAGDRIILTKSDPESGGMHHSLSCSDIDRVEADRVMLDISAEKARERWRSEGHSRALFERERDRDEGPHMLDRSFSGTYR